MFIVKLHDLNIKLLTISSTNIWKHSGLELKDILIQKEYIFIEKDLTNITERTTSFILRNLKLNIDKEASNNLFI
jgi:hypothetical protein